jgi:hypothetical protein
MSPRDLVYVGHMLDMARKAVSKTQGIYGAGARKAADVGNAFLNASRTFRRPG